MLKVHKQLSVVSSSLHSMEEIDVKVMGLGTLEITMKLKVPSSLLNLQNQLHSHSYVLWFK